MSKKWYVVHTYSGYENKVKLALEEKIRSSGKEDIFGDILVPSEKVVEMAKGVKRTTLRKFFPGYILINMDLNDDSWHLVKSVPKVTGFVGGQETPPTVPDEEIEKITRQMEEAPSGPNPRCYLTVVRT